MSRPQNNLIGPCFHNEISRRDFFDRTLKFSVAGGVAAFIANAPFAQAFAHPIQDNWRVCGKCASLFFDGYRNKGRCPAGSAHLRKNNLNFKLMYATALPQAQNNWRFCNKCEALFFDGYPNKGVCPASGGHFAQGYNFTLSFNPRFPGQPEWRFCNKCEVLFFNGEANKGVCAARGVHVAAGYRFVLDDTVPFNDTP